YRKDWVIIIINIILQRDNFFEASNSDFNWDKDYVSYKEKVFSVNIDINSETEIEKIISKYYELIFKNEFHRNGHELINDHGVFSLNLLIYNYPINEVWEEDKQLRKFITDFSNLIMNYTTL